MSLRSMFPSGFGNKKKSQSKAKPKQQEQAKQEPVDVKDVGMTADEEQNMKIGFGTAKVLAQPQQQEFVDKVIHYDNISEDEEEEVAQSDKVLPIANHATLKGHKSVVSALAIDHSGSRMISGSFDYSLKFWDFAGMTQSLNSFREKPEACGNNPIHHISWSPKGDYFVVAPFSTQARLLDRDGFEKLIFKKGDQYLSDKNFTKGHTATITGLQWHPRERNIVMSVALDSTIRIWDIETAKDKQIAILKTRTEKGTNAQLTSCAYNKEGDLLCGACNDGSVQIWKANITNFTQRPNMLIRNGHASDVTSVSFSKDGNTLTSRGLSDAAVWDMRNLKHALKTVSDIPTNFSMTDILFSPDDRYILTGYGKDDGGNAETGKGQLIWIDKKTLEPVQEVTIPNGVPVRMGWHPLLNQIVVGSSSSDIFVYYDETVSVRGVISALKKVAKKKHVDDVAMVAPVIHTPYALPIFRPEPSKMRQKEKARKDPNKSSKPAVPPQDKNKGQGGRVVESMTHIMMKEIGIVNDAADIYTDPREAILKYAEEAAKNPTIVGPAYKETQPVPIFDYSDFERAKREREQQDEAELEKTAEHKFKKRRHS